MDQENRKLPEIDIQGTTFQFDIDRILLIEKDNPVNAITFAYMTDHETHYSFDYSSLTKNHHFIMINKPDMADHEIAQLVNKLLDPEINPPLKVEIPRITELDPKGFCRKYECTEKDIAEKTDFELMVDLDMYNKRIDGHPVKVTICGNEYIVDPENDILWSMGNKPDIELRTLENYYNPNSKAFEIFYEPISGRIIDILNKSMDESDLVRMVQIPHIRTLDPIGKNHAENLPLTFGLIYHKLRVDHDLLFTLDDISQIIPAIRNEQGQMELLIEGTTFIVDINTFEYRDKSNPNNKIELKEMLDNEEGGYMVFYKNKEILLPEFVVLDPEGMAKKYNVTIDEVKKHDDFFFMVDQKAFDIRMQGQLPTLEIEGHILIVDMRMNMLRSASDFASKGISFDEIDHYYSEEKDAYIIPYDPIKKEFRELDYDNLFSIPKDLIAVEFPFQTKLDPIGWNHAGGWDLKEDLKWLGVKNHFKAKTIPWEQTYIVDIIRDNMKKFQKQQDDKQEKKATNTKKGPRI